MVRNFAEQIRIDEVDICLWALHERFVGSNLWRQNGEHLKKWLVMLRLHPWEQQQYPQNFQVHDVVQPHEKTKIPEEHDEHPLMRSLNLPLCETEMQPKQDETMKAYPNVEEKSQNDEKHTYLQEAPYPQ